MNPLEQGPQALFTVLDAWVERGWLRRLDRAFARFLAAELVSAGAEPAPLVLLAAALASHQLGRGHASLDLERVLAEPEAALSLPPDEETGERRDAVLPSALFADFDAVRWWAALSAQTQVVGNGPGASPLVLEGSRLYLRRYWQYEQDVRAAITARLGRIDEGESALPPTRMRALLDVLFGPPQAAVLDWQRVACALAARSGFAIVTGGPGTGKTTTVLRLLVLLQGLADATNGEGKGLRIRLAAPTGKAAARLAESVSGALDRLPWEAVPDAARLRASVPTTVTTLHRLLGRHAEARRFRHDAANPLALDVLVIDEASMIDLEMLAAVLAALPPQARLVLLGDKDQLAAVEAGAVFGALCAHAEEAGYSSATREWLQRAAGVSVPPGPEGGSLEQAVTMLRESHRFGADSGIGRLAGAVNRGDAATVRALLGGEHADVAWLTVRSPSDAAFARLVLDEGYRVMLDAVHAPPSPAAEQEAFDAWARAVLAAQRRFQVLCALRRGECGVDGLNWRIAEGLRQRGWIEASEGWYSGRPVLVTRNDYELGLMNGDVGVTLALPDGADVHGEPRWRLRVAFAAGDGSEGIRWLLPSRLAAVETVFAMTVHKSQGSEFDHAVLVLPGRANPGLTRELVYTGLTRARRRATLVGTGPSPFEVLDAAVARRALAAAPGLLGA